MLNAQLFTYGLMDRASDQLIEGVVHAMRLRYGEFASKIPRGPFEDSETANGM